MCVVYFRPPTASVTIDHGHNLLSVLEANGRLAGTSNPMQLSPVRIAIVVYAAIYFLLASSMEAENISLGYPFVYIGTSMVAQLLAVAGIFLFALNASDRYFGLWRLDALAFEHPVPSLLHDQVAGEAVGGIPSHPRA
jgi:hypothetical protein